MSVKPPHRLVNKFNENDFELLMVKDLWFADDLTDGVWNILLLYAGVNTQHAGNASEAFSV